MTFFLLYTILMTAVNIINGIFTYRIFKQLSTGDNMGKNKKCSFGKGPHVFNVGSDSLSNDSTISYKHDVDNLEVKEDFDGSFSNPFAEREIQYVLPGETNLTDGMNPVLSEDKEKAQLKTESNNGNINIPIITNDYDFPEDDERMLNRLLFLSDYLNGKYKPLNVSGQEFEDMKWETINETYCLITVDLPRSKAEVVRKYFRRLDTTYAKQDGTYYSKVTKGDLAKEVIDDLIEVYPWNEKDNGKVKVNWDEFRKTNANVVNLNADGKDDKVYFDRLKYAIGNLSKSVDKLNEILLGK